MPELVMEERWLAACVIALAGALGGGCAGSSSRLAPAPVRKAPDPPDEVFPNEAEIEALAAAPEPTPNPDADPIVEAPEAFEWAPSAETGWGDQGPQADAETVALSDALIRRGRHRLTRAAQCVARAVSAFWIAKGRLPGPQVRALMAARCKAPWDDFFVRGQSWRQDRKGLVPGPDRTQAVLKMAKRMDGRAPSDFGAAFFESDEMAFVAIVQAVRRIEVSAVERSPDGGAFMIRGVLLSGGKVIYALVNRGRAGVADCESNPAIALPEFEMKCPTQATDEFARIDVLAAEKEGVLASVVGTFIVSPSQSKNVYRMGRASEATSKAIRDGQQLRDELLAEIQGMRASADLPSLRFEVAQSTVATTLAPRYFGASKRQERRLQERIGLGLRAGYKVGGVVRYARFGSMVTAGTRTASMVVERILERPFLRQVVMDPDVSRIALGCAWKSKDRVAQVIIITFADFEGFDPLQVGALAMRRLMALRKAAGRDGAGVRWNVLPGIRSRLRDALINGDTGLRGAIDWLVQRYAEGSGLNGPVQVFGAEAHRVEHLPWPDAIVKADKPVFDLVVAYRRPQGHAWGRYVVLIATQANTLAPDSRTPLGGTAAL